ncbi:MAG: hypothetical protein AAB225_11590 [Acidobacteriota bacterium]
MGTLVACTLMAGAMMATELRIRVEDEGGRPVWARLEVRGPDGKMHQPAGAVLDTVKNARGGGAFYLGSFVIRDGAVMEVPPGRYTVIAERGLEYERVERAVDAPGSVELRPRPWIRMNDRGWWSADLHVHRRLEDASALAQAEDLNLMVLTTMWNQRNLWAGKPWPSDPVVRVSPRHLVTLLNAEDERGGGAWMLNALREALPLAVPGRWYPPGLVFIRQARAQRPPGGVLPWFDCEKPIWWEVPVVMALAAPDSFGVLHNHFMQYGIHANEAWGRPRDQAKFPGAEGFVEYTTGLYYRYLNLGFRLAPSAGSASGVLPNPVGYSRVYAQLDGPLSVEKFYTAMREGKSFVSNGPMLFFTATTEGRVRVEARAHEPIDRVEIVANGTVLKRWTPPASAKTFKGSFTFDARKHSWVAARCFLKPGATIRLAHSSPGYLPGKFDARADARYFVEWIDELIAQTAADRARFTSDAERDEVLALYRQARAVYEAKTR